MGSVVALAEFRQSIEKSDASPPRRERPKISGGEIWGRNYNEVEAIVFGLLKIRDIVAYHTGSHDYTFDHLCLDGLAAAYNIGEMGPLKLKAAIKPIKEWILDEMTEDNKRDMAWALVIVDLIEKSPSK